MQTISQLLEDKFRHAFNQVGISRNTPIILVEATRVEFGDFQINGIMAAAKQEKTNPRDLAAKVIANVDLAGIADKIEIAGPGFINITLDNKFLAKFITTLTPENKFGAKSANNQTVVVDLSSPNLAKEMHVGHLRSTVIGDSLARIFSYIGNNVIRQNHVGDWGTQFGMLIAYMQERYTSDDTSQLEQHFAIPDLEQFYREAKIKFDKSAEFAEKAREYVVKLQSGDKTTLQYWELFTRESQKHCDLIYTRLGICLGSNKSGGYYIDDNNQKHEVLSQCGESFYNDRLPQIINRLEQAKLITISDGARCVFFAPGELSGGEETPFIVQKQDGGYLYASTDLAAINYRVHTLKADKIVYVVDARQAFHFKQLFIVSKKAGFAKTDTGLIHSAFGTMMTEDGRPFKTRDGGTVKLIDLIDEATSRARAMVNERNPDWDGKDKQHLANVLAIGAIKYADLSKNRASDYIFSFEKMLAFDGNTAPYLLYANTRIQSVLRRANEHNFNFGAICLEDFAEHKLALHLAKFPEMLATVAAECYPHYLCQYLYNLSGLFMQFYELCPILKADNAKQQQSRLSLSRMTAAVLQDGLDLLGIQTIDRM